TGQLEKAEAIGRRFLTEAPDAASIEFTADLLASQGQTEEAETILAQLDSIELPPGIRESMQAEFNRFYGSLDEAQRLYEEAIAAAGNNPNIWRRMLGF